MNYTDLDKLLQNALFINLIISMFIYWVSLLFSQSKIISNIAKYSTITANCILFFDILSRWINAKYFPLSNLYESILFLCWALLFGQILIEKKTNSKLLGTINIPIVLLLNTFATLTLPPEMQKIVPLVPSLQSNWLMMHVTMMMISYATLLLGSLLCLLYVVLDLKKTNKTPLLNTLPNLQYVRAEKGIKLNSIDINENSKNETKLTTRISLLNTIDFWSYRIIGLGFPFLSLGIISGAVWANEAWGSYWSWDPKETWALITWLVFAIYLHARLTKGLKGKESAIIGASGFFVIWICYLGVNFLGQGLHSYGWLS
jgi:cytochrome c-type biogenesis protein CcsB